MPSQRQLAMFAPCLAVVVATGAYIATGPSGAADSAATLGATAHPAGYGSSIATSGSTTLSQVAAAEALCLVQPDAVRSLARRAPDASALDNVRVELPVLTDRISTLQQAAVGRPAIKPVITHVNDIRKAWTKAVSADDQAKPVTAQKALRLAGKQLKPLTAALTTAYPAYRTDCTG